MHNNNRMIKKYTGEKFPHFPAFCRCGILLLLGAAFPTGCGSIASSENMAVSADAYLSSGVSSDDASASTIEHPPAMETVSSDFLFSEFSAGFAEELAGAMLPDDSVSDSSEGRADNTAQENNAQVQADNTAKTNDELPFSLADIQVRYYQSRYRTGTFDDVTLSYENGTILLNIPYDVSDADTRNAYISFDSDQYTCTLNAPEGITDASASGNQLQNPGVNLTDNAYLYIQGFHVNNQYPLVVHRTVHKIPVLYLSTDSGEDVTDRYEYVSGQVTIDNSCQLVVSNGSNYASSHAGSYYENTYKREQDKRAAAKLDGQTFSMNIRGRGNASWWKFAQKSYMLKFNQNISLFGMTSSKRYALVSTYGDPSLIRNCVAMDIATTMDHLEYTTGQIPVDVFLNGTYLGVYTLSEKIDTAPDKVDLFSQTSYAGIKMNGITDIPFLVECGAYVKDTYTNGLDYFYTPHSPQLFVKYPEITGQYNDTITYITNYMTEADQAMTRGYGYEDYIDVDSFVDWFLVMELTNNTDSALCRSTYLYKRADSKLYIGPVWDFDMAFGNYAYDNPTYEYWATAEPIFVSAQNHYMSYLYKSDDFMLAAQERWDEKKEELLDNALKAVDKYADLVSESRIYNNHVRGSGGTSYQVDAVRQFIIHRYNWIDMSIHMADFNRHEPTESVPVFETEDIPLLELDENAADDEIGNTENTEAETPEAAENAAPEAAENAAAGEAEAPEAVLP